MERFQQAAATLQSAIGRGLFPEALESYKRAVHEQPDSD
jgi:hypothetical protein